MLEMPTFDGDSDLATDGWWNSVVGRTFVNIVALPRHLVND